MLRAMYEFGRHAREGAEGFARAAGLPSRPAPGLTPRSTVWTEGSARLDRIVPREGGPSAGTTPVLLVPSLINRWYVLDLHERGSLVRVLRDAGIDVWVLDWGVAHDEDRHLDWSALVRRISRAMAVLRRTTGAPRCILLGYSIAGTLAVITAAREPDRLAGLINLAGPVDFSRAARLERLTDPRWFDADAIASAGNVAPAQMLGGFLALRPTQLIADAVRWVDLSARGPREERDAVLALAGWAYDNVPFPAAAYGEYVRSLFQGNALIRGEHVVDGARVDLSRIDCPLLTIVADRDAITPEASALALETRVSSVAIDRLRVRGGHVSGVVHPSARERFHPQLVDWLRARVASADRAGLPSRGLA
jgi:polyhydroxyalkanoate synthase